MKGERAPQMYLRVNRRANVEGTPEREPHPALEECERMRKAIGAVIRKRRLALDLGQGVVAKRAGTHRPLVARVENGTHQLGVGTLVRYARALGCPAAELVREAEALCAELAAAGCYADRASARQLSMWTVDGVAPTGALG